MSWTVPALVRAHVVAFTQESTQISNDEIVLTGTDSVSLSHSGLQNQSETVKTVELSAPMANGLEVLTGSAWASFSYTELVPGSVVVADSSILLDAQIYVEGDDFVIDYDGGRIQRTASSSIPDGGTIYAWYLYFTTHTRSTDYTISFGSGTIKRVSSGSIADGASVFVDYTVSTTSLSDELIADAIRQAEGQIRSRISDSYDSSGYEVSGSSGTITSGSSTLTDTGAFTGLTLGGRLLFLDDSSEVVTIISNTDDVITIDGVWTSSTGSFSYQVKHADLVTGATLLAVPLARLPQGGSERDAREVSEMYAETAWLTLSPYLSPIAATGPLGLVNEDWADDMSGPWQAVSPY